MSIATTLCRSSLDLSKPMMVVTHRVRHCSDPPRSLSYWECASQPTTVVTETYKRGIEALKADSDESVSSPPVQHIENGDVEANAREEQDAKRHSVHDALMTALRQSR